MNMTLKEPYYMIEFSASAVMFEIRINDVPLLTLNVKGQASTVVPMNYLILESGKQQLNITVLPVLGKMDFIKNSSFRATVKLFDVVNGFKFIEDSVNYKTPSIDEDKPIPVFNYQGVFYAEVPYKLVAWQNSTDLSEIEDLQGKVDKQYSHVEDIIKSQKYNSLRKMLEQRENNMAISMYLSEEEKNSRIDDLIKDIENGFVVVPRMLTDKLMIYGNNKLVSLKKENGSSALLLRNEKIKEDLNLDLMLHIEQGSKELSII